MTYEELASADISLAEESENYYCVGLKGRSYYDNTVYKVNKKTHEVTEMIYMDWFSEPGAHGICPSDIKW